MNRVWGRQSILMTLFFLAVPALAGTFTPRAGGVRGQYIVVLQEGIARRAGASALGAPGRTVAGTAWELSRAYGGEVRQVWEHALQGFVIRLPEAAARRLAESPWVRSVEQDFPLSAPIIDCGSACQEQLPQNTRPFPTSPQSIVCDNPDPQINNATCIDNWGLDRIDQQLLPRDNMYSFLNDGTGVHVYVIDSGIYAAHRELSGHIGNGVNTAVAFSNNLDDCLCNSHGTFVSSLIGGRTYGTAKGVTIHPVKVFETCGATGGSLSTVIAGVNWITQNHSPAMGPAVANHSGGNWPEYVNSTAFSTAIKGVIQHGISYVQAAGNQDRDACSWSMGSNEANNGVENIIIAGAFDELRTDGPLRNGRWIKEPGDPYYNAYCVQPQLKDKACGSNYGSCVDIWAPGAHIVGAAKSNNQIGGYCRLSGTSMAAAEVTGVIARYLQNHPAATPQQVKAALLAGAMPNVLDTTTFYSIKPGSPNLLLQVVP